MASAGIEATIEHETLGFGFPSFDLAWEVLAGVTAAGLPLERQGEAKAAVMGRCGRSRRSRASSAT
jgi:hypothetical protein